MTACRSLVVAICCGDDARVKATVASLRPDTPVVLGLTPSHELEEWADQAGIPWAPAPPGNHAATANAALSVVPSDADVLLLDSDCELTPGAERVMQEGLRTNPVVKLPIRFRDDGGFLSGAVANCRMFDNTFQTPAYKPGLGLSAELRARIGRVFDPRVRHGCDSELDWRLRHLGITPLVCDDAAVIHDVTPVRQLLAGSWDYGQDDCYRWHRLGQRRHERLCSYELGRYRVMLRMLPASSLPLMGLCDGVYHVAWIAERLAMSMGRGHR